MDLTTTYLGLTLAHPFMAGASPLSGDLDTVRRLEDGGSAAIVLPSLFEEQITMADSGKIHQMDPLDAEFAAVLSGFPLAQTYAAGPDEYLDHIRRVKAAVHVPVIASLNGMTGESWLKFAFEIQKAGADALELNLDEIVIDPHASGTAVEREIRNVVGELKRELKIPIAVKLTPFFTAFANLATQLDAAGAGGLVLFNRFSHPDLDMRDLKVVPRLTLSHSSELPLRLHWVAVLHGRVRASLAVAGGIATPDDGIKAILVGGDAVQMISAILRNGTTYFTVMRDGLSSWGESQRFTSIAEVRGRMSLQHTADPSLYERANYLRTLQSWIGRQ
jgi:dihydroorotate dehydrogenase (fumarate)